jgi:hypothetical protein
MASNSPCSKVRKPLPADFCPAKDWPRLPRSLESATPRALEALASSRELDALAPPWLPWELWALWCDDDDRWCELWWLCEY